jgi:hypothetical protein
MAAWRTKASALFGFPPACYSRRRGKVELFRDLVEKARTAATRRDNDTLGRIREYVSWAAAQKSPELDSALDLAFFLPVFQDATLKELLRPYLPIDLFLRKWEILMEEPG